MADDHRLILDGVCTALQSADDIEVVGVTQTGAEVLDLVGRERPDLLLLDYRLPGIDGLACLRLIQERHPEVKVVMLSASEERSQIADALEAGASAYISKRIDSQELAAVIRQVVSGVVFHRSPPADEDRAERDAQRADVALTEREHTMLEAISRGLSTKSISREYWISETTVKFHLTNLYRKLGASNRTSAMRYALERGLVPPPSAEIQQASA